MALKIERVALDWKIITWFLGKQSFYHFIVVSCSSDSLVT